MFSRLSFFQCVGLVCLLVGNCRAHTVKICALEQGTDVIWYAGTYHSQSELNLYGATVGSVVLTASDGTVSSHAFTSLATDVSELPPDCVSGSCQCHTCSSYTSTGIVIWQQVTVSGLTSGSYSAVASCTTAVECPWCTNLPAFTINLGTGMLSVMVPHILDQELVCICCATKPRQKNKLDSFQNFNAIHIVACFVG